MNTSIFKIPKSGPVRYLMIVLKFLASFTKTPEEGAMTSLYACCATDAGHMGGEYFSDCKPKLATPFALDMHRAQQADEQTRHLLKEWL